MEREYDRLVEQVGYFPIHGHYCLHSSYRRVLGEHTMSKPSEDDGEASLTTVGLIEAQIAAAAA